MTKKTEKIKGNVQIVYNVIITPIQLQGNVFLKRAVFLQRFEINATVIVIWNSFYELETMIFALYEYSFL